MKVIIASHDILPQNKLGLTEKNIVLLMRRRV